MRRVSGKVARRNHHRNDGREQAAGDTSVKRLAVAVQPG